LLGTLDRQNRYLGTQAVTSALNLLSGVLLGLCQDTSLFSLGLATSLVNNACSLLFGFEHASMVLSLRRRFDHVDARLRLSQVCLALFGSGEAIGDLLTAIVHCFRKWRPYEFHRKPSQYEKHDHLKKESRV